MSKKSEVMETPDQKQQREIIGGIAKNISMLARSVVALLGGPLKKKTVIVLLAASSGLSRNDCDRVLTALADLEKDWLNQ